MKKIVSRESIRTGRRTGGILMIMVSLLFLACNKKEIAPEIPGPDEKVPRSSLSSSASDVPDFTIVIMPDTQHYTSGIAGGTNAMFMAEINWIKENKTDKNIVYVIGVGDITQYGDREPEDYVRAKNGYYSLEASNIPYGLAVGNHDQWPQGYPLTGTTNEYNKWFGVSHFSGMPYYGGHYGGNNDSHYDLFSASGEDFIVIYIEYDNTGEDSDNMNTWAYNILKTHASRKAIIVTHYMIKRGNQADFSPQGRSIYERVKSLPNVFMMVGGHLSGPPPHGGEGYREDVYNGNTIRSYLVDYQGYEKTGNGGGFLRFMQFSINSNEVIHKTYSPFLDRWEKDEDSDFAKVLFDLPPFKISAKHTGKSIAVKDAAMDNNAAVVQFAYSDDETENDEWNFIELGNTGWYKIINAKSGKAMAVKDASMGLEANIVQYAYTDDGKRNDEWGLYDAGGGYYKIINRASGHALKAKGNSDGDQCVQTDFQFLDSEKFQIVSVP